MSAEEQPPAETCVHNLYREVPGRDAAGEPTDLCRNELGVFHMVDCPLTMGMPCTYFEAVDGPREVLTDDEVVSTRNLLHEDFLGWHYRNRVRALSRPVGSVPEKIELEAVPEPEPEPGSDLTFGQVEAVEAPVEEAPPAAEPAAPEARPEERYPGQRRSEDRRAKARARRTAAAAGASEDEPPVVEDSEAPPADSEAPVAEPEEERGPLTLDELFDTLPEAPLPEPKPKGDESGRKRRSGRGRGGRSRGPRSRRGPEKPAAAAGEGGGGKSAPGGEKPKRRRRRRPNKPRTGEKAPGGEAGRRDGSKGPPADGSRSAGSGEAPPRRRRRRRRPRSGGSGGGGEGGGSSPPPSGD